MHVGVSNQAISFINEPFDGLVRALYAHIQQNVSWVDDASIYLPHSCLVFHGKHVNTATVQIIETAYPVCCITAER